MLRKVLRISILVFLVTLTFAVVHISDQNCTIDIKKDLHDFAPLILHADTLEFAYPDKGKSVLQLRQGEKLSVFCPGKKNRLNVTFGIFKNAIVTCDQQSFALSDAAIKLPFNSIKCIKHPQSYVKRNHTDPTVKFSACKNNFHAIGFSVTKNKFLKVLEMCFDQKLQRPVISHAEIYPTLNGSQRRPRKQVRFNSALFNSRVERVYSKDEQRKTFRATFGNNLAEKYITTSIYLQRGHLMARADFYYQSQQVSSYYYLNVVPMWSVINSGNWAVLENAVRQLAIKKGKNLQVWTGSFGVLELEDNSWKLQEIYLLDARSVPVPKYLFKIIFDETANEAVIFITINNPFLKQLPTKYLICNDIMHEIRWITWNRMNYTKGFTYACSYDEFKRVFNVIPELNVKSLLTSV